MRTFLTGLGNEIYKGLRFAWSERLQIVIELPMFAVLLLLLGPVIGQADQIAGGQMQWSLDSETTSVLVMWFIPFIFFYMQVVKTFWRLLGEMQAGTLEQVYLSPLPSWLVIAAGRVTAALLETVVVAAGIFGIVRAFVPLHLGWSASALLPAALIMVTGVGLSLVIAGATLVWRRIQMILESTMLLVVMASVAAVPALATLPTWWTTIGSGFPLNAGVSSLYGVFFQDRSVTTLWGDGGLVWVTATAAAYLAIGILTFRLCEKSAKRRGSLGRY